MCKRYRIEPSINTFRLCELYRIYIYAERVRHYLLEEMKYDMKEIKEIKGIYGGKLPSCIVTVTFRDEPW